MTAFQAHTYIPLHLNPLSSDFNFLDVFLVDFDNLLLSHGGDYLINSQRLYLTSKNQYIQYTLSHSNTFINLQHTLLQTRNIHKFNFNSDNNNNTVAHQLKTIFKHQFIAFKHFLHYIQYILQNTPTNT
jgi:hypothetical protein